MSAGDDETLEDEILRLVAEHDLEYHVVRFPRPWWEWLGVRRTSILECAPAYRWGPFRWRRRIDHNWWR